LIGLEKFYFTSNWILFFLSLYLPHPQKNRNLISFTSLYFREVDFYKNEFNFILILTNSRFIIALKINFVNYFKFCYAFLSLISFHFTISLEIIEVFCCCCCMIMHYFQKKKYILNKRHLLKLKKKWNLNRKKQEMIKAFVVFNKLHNNLIIYIFSLKYNFFVFMG